VCRTAWRPRLIRRPRVRIGTSSRHTLALLAPVLVFIAILLLWPLWEILRGGLSGGQDSLDRLTANPIFGLVVQNTLVVSALTTLISTALAYLVALLAWRTSGVRRVIVFAFVLLPFWTGVLVKNFAWTELLQEHGPINSALLDLHVIDEPLTLLHNRLAVVIGMVHYCLPYAVFPIFAAMLPIDPRLDQAAESLGAGRWQRARHVILPLTLPGVLASALLVFIISVGFFITPVLLGGPADRMVANLIDYYERQLVDFNTASMLAVLVTIAVSVLVAIYNRIPKEGQYGRA
jgi:ABC-type spermidine/putrescine transport system permease subunit I